MGNPEGGSPLSEDETKDFMINSDHEGQDRESDSVKKENPMTDEDIKDIESQVAEL